MRDERQRWFENFKGANKLNPYSLFVFHTATAKDNQEYGVIMDRGFVKTTSITRIEKEGDQVSMRYYDIAKNNHEVKFLSEFSQIHE